MNLRQRWSEWLSELRACGRYRQLSPAAGVDLSSNDYLGYGSGRRLINSPTPDQLSELGEDDLPESGLASRLLRGQHPIWEKVEAALADWHGAESALFFNSGYAANEGLFSSIIEPDDWVASDQLNHASIIDGLRLAQCERYVFPHRDLNRLEAGLVQAAAQRRRGRELFIVTESLFSMDGDQADLAAVVELAERYGAHVIVDEAHATGGFGMKGSGLVDAAGLRPRILATVHTGGKALGVSGAYVCGSKLMREVLINRCRHFIFTTAPPPALGGRWLAALPRVQSDIAGRGLLHGNAALFRQELQRRGIVAGGESYIVPIVIGQDAAAAEAARRLADRGWDIRAIRPPSVPQNTARLRVSIHADHAAEVLICAAEDVAAVYQTVVLRTGDSFHE
jgi:8-amino-7-oxononanoate synthase